MIAVANSFQPIGRVAFRRGIKEGGGFQIVVIGFAFRPVDLRRQSGFPRRAPVGVPFGTEAHFEAKRNRAQLTGAVDPGNKTRAGRLIPLPIAGKRMRLIRCCGKQNKMRKAKKYAGKLS